MPVAPAGRHVTYGGRHYLVTSEGRYYEATGAGQVAGLDRLYGPSQPVGSVAELGTPTQTTVVQLFGGPGGIEGYSAPSVNTPPPAPTQPTAPPQTPVPTTPTTPALTIEQRARLSFPWLPEPILARFTDAWIELGDPELALAKVRADPTYQQYFPGNRRADGSLRLSEADYYSTVLGYRDVFSDYGLNPAEFESRGLFAKAIEGELSVNEVARRARGIFSSIEGDIPAIRDFYATNYGLADITPAAVFASAIDSTIGEDILARRLTSAQIGGVASSFGFARTRDEAERLAGLGVDRAQAQQLYSRAQAQLPGLQSYAERYGDLDPTVDIDEFELAAVSDDVTQQRRFARLVASEQASFTGYEGVARDRGGALIGLRQR